MIERVVLVKISDLYSNSVICRLVTLLFKRRNPNKIKSIPKDLFGIVVKVPFSVVKPIRAYANTPFTDVLCISWSKVMYYNLFQTKKVLPKPTRPFYENTI